MEVQNSLARVTSYNKLERSIDEEDVDSVSDKYRNETSQPPEESKNQDLKPGYDVIQLD